MSELNVLPVEPDPELIKLAKILGARQAIGMIAGRCSAADAEMLCQIRDQKKYLCLSPTWEEFCKNHLHISKRHADRTIRLLNELGPGYFELSQLTRISPQEFRAIADHVHNQTIHFNGEAIALIEANTEKVAAAVNELRERSGCVGDDEPSATRVAGLERRCERLVHEFYRLSEQSERYAVELAPLAERAMMMFDSLHLSLMRLRSRR